MLEKVRQEVDKKKTHDFRGEEGLLYRTSVNGEPLWAKKWHRSHDKAFYMPIELGGSSLSPFWHKKIELSYSIVHELFPNDTIDVIGSYDERVSSSMGNIREFEPMDGKPVTVSREAVGDPELCAIRDDIMNQYYAVLLERRDEGARRGATKEQMAPFFAAERKKVNAKIVSAIGPEIELDSLITSVVASGFKGLDQLAKRIRARNPKNVMADFLDAGISAGHPEVNFVPGTKELHPNPPHGTFVELSIADSKMLVAHISRKFANNPRKRDELLSRFRSYEIYTLVDQLFDKILLAFIQKTQGRGDAESLGKICLTLEKFRQVTEKFGLTIDPSSMERSLVNIVVTSTNSREAMSRLQREFITPMEAALA
ncbi:hypothetical protein KBC97_01915 [Candidatus Gracilibacteria bacterium]|nr:hypothetical protein [Candidatus Gracilibacteria bacterium]